MEKFSSCAPAPGMQIHRVEQNGSGLTVLLSGKDRGCCPSCGTRSTSRHSCYSRHLGDLPAHGSPVTAVVTVTRWRCQNARCSQRISAGTDPLAGHPLRAANQSNENYNPSVWPWRRWEAVRTDHGSLGNADLPYFYPSPTQGKRAEGAGSSSRAGRQALMNGPGGRERLTGRLSLIWRDVQWWNFCQTAQMHRWQNGSAIIQKSNISAGIAPVFMRMVPGKVLR